MRRFLGSSVAFCFALGFLVSSAGGAANQGFWYVAGGDPGHNGWQKGETKITKETLAGEFRFLWKIKLGNGSTKSESFSEPLLLHFLPTGRGFKDLAFWADSNSLYAVDSELGTLFWQKDFKLQSSRAKGACGGSNIQIIMEGPRSIHFGGGHSAAPPSTPSLSPPAVAPLRIGVVPPGLHTRGIYALTSDGYIHEQILNTGIDYAPAVKFLPASNGFFSALNMDGKVVYTATGGGCPNLPNGAWSIDLESPDDPVNAYNTRKPSLSGLMGPAIGPDGTVYVATGTGPADSSAGVYANSVVALTAKDLKVKDWYTPSDRGKGVLLNAGPEVFTYKDKELVAAPGQDGGIVLLDSESLGGPDHHTPLAQTDTISKAAGHSAGDGISSWQENDGTLWVLASISGPVEPGMKFADTNGPAPHGSIVAFKLEDHGGHLTLTPSWISRDLKNPAPPVIVNGIVFALSGGDTSTHATLYGLDAATGKELYSSGGAIETYTHRAGLSIGDGHVFFTTHDDTLYSFGIPMEH